MKNLLTTLLLISLLSCKNDSERIVSKQSNDTSIYYKNQFKSGGIKDSNASVNFDLAIEQELKGNYKKAEKLYQRASDMEPNNKIILNALGTVSSDLKNLDDCVKYYEKSLQIDSLHSITYLNFGTSYNKLLQFDKSIEILNRGLELENNTERKGYFYYNLANSYYKKKNYKKSAEFNNKALSIVKELAIREDIMELKDVLLESNNQ